MQNVAVERWRSLADGSQRAAASLVGAENNEDGYRSATSRAHYAAFSEATALMVELGCVPPTGWMHWKHRDLPPRLKVAMEAANRNSKIVKEVLRLLRASYSMRIDADSRPGRTVDRAVAREALRVASGIRRLFRG